MKKRGIFILLLFSFGAIAQAEEKTSGNMPQSSKIENRIVKTGEKSYSVVDRNGKHWEVDTTTLTVKFKEGKELGREYTAIRSNKLGYIDLSKPAGISIEEYADLLSKDERIESIIHSTYGEWCFVPNDQYLSNQWHLSAINAYQAWDITTGSPDIIVAILDSGTDWTHPDLGLGTDMYQNIYLNPGEDAWFNPNDPSTGNGIDDDNNGFIDDWKGWNFDSNSNDSRGTSDHGTFVAGIVGAKTNNNNGIAGVAGGKNNEGFKLLTYCIGYDFPISSVLDDAIIAAVNNGAKVIQLSCSVSESNDINAAIQYAINHNVTIVCSSGNWGVGYVNYPASHPLVIAVGATDQNNQRASFSQTGYDLNMVAPGVDIYSTTLGDTCKFNRGTSFSAPQVSAAAALLLSIDSTLTPVVIKGILGSTAQKISSKYSYYVNDSHPQSTWCIDMGYGLLDVYAALQKVQCTPITFANQTITADTTIYNCVVNVQNVTVQNWRRLYIGAYKSLKINGPFKAERGALFKASPNL